MDEPAAAERFGDEEDTWEEGAVETGELGKAEQSLYVANLMPDGYIAGQPMLCHRKRS